MLKTKDAFPRAMVYFEKADRNYVRSNATTLDPVKIPNLALFGSSGVKIKMSSAVNGAYVFNEKTVASPSYCTYHGTSTLDPILELPLGGDNDVIELCALGAYSGGVDSLGLKPLTSHFELTTNTSFGNAASPSVADSTLVLDIPIDQVFDGTYYDQEGFITADLSGLTLTPNVDGSCDAPILSTITSVDNDYAQRHIQITWRPFATAANMVQTVNGNPYWYAIRWHKRTTPNTLKVSLICLTCNGGATIKTLTISVAGASIGRATATGIMVTGPRAQLSKPIARAIYVYDVAAATAFNGPNWHLDMAEQGALWISTAQDDKPLTNFSKSMPGVISQSIPFLPVQPVAYLTPFATPSYIRGLVRHGREIMLIATNISYDVTGGSTAGADALARVDLVSPSGIVVKQFIKTWGTGKINYRGLVTGAGPLNNMILLKVDTGPIPQIDLPACKFIVYDAAGAIEFQVSVAFNG